MEILAVLRGLHHPGADHESGGQISAQLGWNAGDQGGVESGINATYSNLTTRHESAFKEPRSVDDAPPDFIEGLMQAIVGLEIEIESLSGKLKASQNQPEQNRAGVRAALESAGRTNQRAMAKLIP